MNSMPKSHNSLRRDFLFPVEVKRNRTDWGGISYGDAFRFQNSTRVRMTGLSLLYDKIKDSQKNIKKVISSSRKHGESLQIKPQYGPCYTDYPSRMAAIASIGLTAFLEYKTLVSNRLLEHKLKDFLDNPDIDIEFTIDPGLYKKLLIKIIHTVQTRLLLEELKRYTEFTFIEGYRLFTAAQAVRKPDNTVIAIIREAILYGDLLSAVPVQSRSDDAQTLLEKVNDFCRPFLKRLPNTSSELLIEFGVTWVKSFSPWLLQTLQQMYRSPKATHDKAESTPLEKTSITVLHTESIESLLGKRFKKNLSFIEQDIIALKRHLGEETDEENQQRILNNLTTAIKAATGEQGNWEDPRSDLVALSLIDSPFERGVMEGSLIDGHQVIIQVSESEFLEGEQFDTAISPSDDLDTYNRLIEAAQPTTAEIQRILYPSVDMSVTTRRLRTSGLLDPARLPLHDISTAVYRRSRIEYEPDRSGSALLVIACDGSGSLNQQQMKILKTLTTSWLLASSNTELQILAGFYHSGYIRSAFNGPLVQWIIHPKKSPVQNNKDAVRALVSLPDNGTGAQSDALSLAFIMDEARQLSSNAIYLIHLTDCKWNKSFNNGKSGQEEVQQVIRNWRENIQHLHITTVALGVSGQTGIDSLVDKTIRLNDSDLFDDLRVVSKISRYVSGCMCERNQTVS